MEWDTLKTSEFGDPTSRERFFIVGRQAAKATLPEPTHHADRDGLAIPRPAADSIDWTDPGTSIWTRDLTEPRVHTPPKNTTMQRLAESIRRHCDDRLQPFADVLERLDRDEIRDLRDRGVPAHQPDVVAEAIDKPFLVDTPADATGGAFVLRQQDGAHPIDVWSRPPPTIATRGGHAVATTAATPLIESKQATRHALEPALSRLRPPSSHGDGGPAVQARLAVARPLLARRRRARPQLADADYRNGTRRRVRVLESVSRAAV